MASMPTVSSAVGAAVLEELRSSDGNDFVLLLLQRLEAENPCLANFITHFALQQEDPLAVTMGALLTYRLIESQCEADTLNDEFLGGDPDCCDDPN